MESDNFDQRVYNAEILLPYSNTITATPMRC